MDAACALGLMPFVTAREVANMEGKSVSSVSGELETLRNRGVATCLEGGTGGHRQRRWCLTDEGLKRLLSEGDGTR